MNFNGYAQTGKLFIKKRRIKKMSLNIYNFSDFAGIARTDNQGDYELRIYLGDEDQTNVMVAIITKNEDVYNLYNFILDKDHLKNMAEMNWFHPITEIELYLDKITNNVKLFINYALKHKVKVSINTKPF